MIQPPSGSGRATAEEDVCRPRPVTGLTVPTARSASGITAFTRVDLPTPDWPMSTLIRPLSCWRSGASLAGVSGRPSTTWAMPSGAYACSSSSALPRRRVGQRADDDHLVGVGDDDPLDRVGVVRRAAQRGGPRGDPHHPRERARRARCVPGQRHLVADDNAPPAQLAGAHRGDRAIADQDAVPAPVDRGDEALHRVLVRGPAPGARAGAPPRPHPDVVFVQVPGAGGQGTRSSIDAHNWVKAGNVLPTVAAFATSIPGTARPSTAAAMTSRWSS